MRCTVDPLTEAYPWYTPYQYAGNKPIAAIDIDGLEEYLVVNWLNNLGEIIRSKLKIIKDDNGNVVNRNSTIGGINRSKSTVHTRTIDANGNISDNFSNNLSQVNQIMNVDRNPKIVSQDHSVAGDGIEVKGGTQEYYQTITTYSGGGVVYGSEEVKNLGSRFYPSGKVVNGNFSTSIGDAWISLIKEKIDEFKTQNSKIKITGIQFTLQPTRVNYNFLVRIFEISSKSTS